MSRRKDAAIFRRLFEELAEEEGLSETGLYEQEDEVEAEEEVEVEGEPGETASVEVSADQAADAVETLLADLGLADDVSVEYEEEVEVGEEEVEVGEEEEELELEGWMTEGDDDDDETVDEVYEIDESVIRRELRRMRQRRKLREQEEDRAADADPFLAHGGEDEGDLVVDVSEDDLINALADELGDPDVPEPVVERARRRRMRRLKESRRRSTPRRVSKTRKSSLLEHQNGQLKKQLNEMNLFNAKLLFANKLMQNRDLSTKQQRAIVEALDRAKTIREAKLLYKSLSASLSRTKSGRTLSENRSRLLSSSSRSLRSGSPAPIGVEGDRWAVLAGIKTDD